MSLRRADSAVTLSCLLAVLAVTSLSAPGSAQGPESAQQPVADAAPASEPAEPPLTPPVLVRDVKPEYPERARLEGVSAEVVLDIDIGIDGRVEGASVTRPAAAGGYGFDEAAMRAANQLEFEPARVGEEAVPVRISYRFRFEPAVAPTEPTASTEPAVDEQRPPAAAPPPEPGPTGELAGELVERGTRTPLAGVTVTVFQGQGDNARGYESETDESGRYSFTALSVGQWRILAEPDGYFPLRTAEQVLEGQRTEARYYLERGSYNPYDVLVEGQRPRKEVSRTTLDARRAERVPGTFGDVLSVVQNFPGVARPPAGSGDVVVRGSSPEDTRTFIDSVEVPTLYHFGGLRSVVPSGMLERIEFYPGNFSVFYGRATGGVIDVELKNLQPERFGGYVDVSLIDTGVYLEMPIGQDAAVAVGARRSYIDFVLDAAVPEDSSVSLIAAPRYWDAQLLASYRPAPAHRFDGFLFFSDDELQLLFDNPADINPEFRSGGLSASIDFYRSVIGYEYVPSERFSNELKLSGGRDRRNIALGTQLFFDLDTYLGQVRDTVRYRVDDAFTLRTGIDYVMTRADIRVRLPPPPKEGDAGDGRPDLDATRFSEARGLTYHSPAYFVEAEISPVEPLLLVPGVRADYFSRVDQGAVSPRFNVRYQLDERWTLKGGVGLFVQEPAFDETAEDFGNPALELERAIHYSAGVELQALAHLSFDVTGFYKMLDQLVSRSEEVVQRDGENVPLNYNNGGEGRVVGVEVSARHELHENFFGWFAYTLSRAERKDFGDTAFRLFDFDQTHILTAVASYRLPENWEIGTRFRYVTGDLTTPFVGAVYVSDDDLYEGIGGRTNSARLAAFHQLDLRLDKRWIFDGWVLNAYLDIQNVYNRQNQEEREYNYDFSESTAQQSLPILPVIGLRGEF